MWGKKKEKEGTADQLVTKREQRDSQKKNVEEIEKVLPNSNAFIDSLVGWLLNPLGSKLVTHAKACVVVAAHHIQLRHRQSRFGVC